MVVLIFMLIKKINKKGEFGWEEIGKAIIALVILVVLLLIAIKFKDKFFLQLGKLVDLLRFR